MKRSTINDITKSVPMLIYAHIAMRMELCGMVACGLTTTDDLGTP